MALQFEAVKVALKQDRSGFVLTLNIHPDEIPEELIRDFVGARYGVAMVRIQDNETATPYDNRVKKSGILCRDHSFHTFLNKVCGLDISTEEGAVQAIYTICGIKSRTELNGNKKAQENFDELLKDFEEWKEHDPF